MWDGGELTRALGLALSCDQAPPGTVTAGGASAAGQFALTGSEEEAASAATSTLTSEREGAEASGTGWFQLVLDWR